MSIADDAGYETYKAALKSLKIAPGAIAPETLPPEVVKEKMAAEILNKAFAGVGDVNSTEKGSGARYNAGKPDMSLIPLWTLAGEAEVWEYGKRKYAAWNWAKGMPWSIPIACILRHLAAFQRGEENDPESGKPHIDHIMCNARMLKLYSKVYPEGDDRPHGLI
jgi:hypothetical protein